MSSRPYSAIHAERAIEKHYDRVQIPIQSIPGLGKVTAPIILSELGDLNRFESKTGKKVLAYAGMEPHVRQSGKWVGKVKMSKRGSPTLRTALYQAANMARQHIPHLGEIMQKTHLTFYSLSCGSPRSSAPPSGKHSTV